MNSSDKPRLVDRSRTLAQQRCPRSRYLEYEWGGTGIRKIRAAIPLIVGTYVHRGLAALLLGQDVDDAVAEALGEYNLEMKRRGLELEPGEDAAYAADESRAMIEALIRVYALRALPELMEKYEVLEVEREELWEDFAPGIGWMSRADGLLLERETSDLYVLSFKTAAQWDARTDRQNQHDIQGLSEVAAIEQRLGRWHRQIMDVGEKIRTWQEFELEGCSRPLFELLCNSTAPPRILGVKMIYLLKGRREQYPEDSGFWITNSHLLRGWMRQGITGQEFAWRYKWYGPDAYPDSGKLCGHTLGKGWKRFNTWEAEGGVKAWIELLATGTVQPDAGDPLGATIYEPMPYFRQERDMEDWREQTQAQESYVAEAAKRLELVRVERPGELRRELNGAFPQHKHSCDYPSRCQFQEVCYGDESVLLNPLGTGLYEPREAHHRPELEAGHARERRDS